MTEKSDRGTHPHRHPIPIRQSNIEWISYFLLEYPLDLYGDLTDMRTKIRKYGQAVCIPFKKLAAELFQLRDGDEVDVEVTDSVITIRRQPTDVKTKERGDDDWSK